MIFSKWNGLGNDFIFPALEEVARYQRVWTKKLCCRHFGIGADGVILLRPLGNNDFEMKIYNADGTEAAMCGNAARCATKYIVSRKLAEGKCFHLHTLSGVVSSELLENGDVRVNMGMPRAFLGKIKLRTATKVFTASTVSMGNPHAVIFVDDISAIPLEKWGPILEHDPQFPDRCNIEFAQILSARKIRMRVWERGSGITLACGTGSCAVFVAAQQEHFCGTSAQVELDGGTLFIEHEENGPVMMTGSAIEVYKGETTNEP